MKKLTNTIATLLLALGVLTSCDQNLTEDLIASDDSTELSNEEIKSAVETMSFKYSITAVNDDDTEVVISNDEELTEYGDTNTRAKIVFPIEITVDGETIIVNSKEEMKALIVKKKGKHRKPHFELVYPVTVATEDGEVVIEDKESFKAYRESLTEGTRPAFVYPISVIVEEETIVVNSEEELKALKPEKGNKPSRPDLVYPVSVVTTDGDLEIADRESLKAYKETLEEGVKTEFVYPISVIVEEETIVVNNEDELLALKPEKGNKPSRPELVYPISVVTTDGNIELADKESLKTYKETLEEGVKPEFVYPISVIVEEETIVVNSLEELKALMPKKGRRK